MAELISISSLDGGISASVAGTGAMPARTVTRPMASTRTGRKSHVRRILTPASLFGIPLGLMALGLAWRGAVRLWPLPPVVADTILMLGLAAWLTILLLYAWKWMTAFEVALEEFEHPVHCCFIGLAGVSTSLAGAALQPYSRTAALALLAVGAVWTVGFAIYRTGRLWMGGRDVSATTSVLYLPVVAGGFVTATTAATLGWEEWGQLIFGAGVFSWLAIESVLLGRLYHAPSMPVAIRPTLGIQLAPPAVGALAYLNVGPGLPDIFVHALTGYAILQALLLIRLLPWIAAQGFTAGFWSFSFGTGALASVVIRLALRGDPVDRVLAAPVFIFGNAVIAILVVLTLHLLAKGQLIPVSAPVQAIAAVNPEQK